MTTTDDGSSWADDQDRPRPTPATEDPKRQEMLRLLRLLVASRQGFDDGWNNSADRRELRLRRIRAACRRVRAGAQGADAGLPVDDRLNAPASPRHDGDPWDEGPA